MLTKKILSNNPLIFTINNFLDNALCKEIISNYKKYLSTSKVIVHGEKEFNNQRKSDSFFIIKDDIDINKIRSSLSELLDVNEENFEPPQITRYKPGDYYKKHFDGFEDADNQRLKTCIFYLSESVGGETYFDNLNINIAPEVGKLLVFDNCFQGTKFLNPGSLHSSQPVIEDEKFILTLWLRSEEYSLP